VQKTKNIPGWFIHVLAVYAFFPAHYIPGTTFVPHFEPFHFIPLSFHVHTSAPHSFGSFLPFHSASSINPVSHYPSHSPTHFHRYVFIFCVELAPMDRILLVLIRNGFFFQKDSRDKNKYNKDFLSIIFTDKKIKNLAKIRRPTQFNALGSKVPMFVNAFSKHNYSWRPKTRITFFGLDGTAPKVISRFVRVVIKLTTTFFLNRRL